MNARSPGALLAIGFVAGVGAMAVWAHTRPEPSRPAARATNPIGSAETAATAAPAAEAGARSAEVEARLGRARKHLEMQELAAAQAELEAAYAAAPRDREVVFALGDVAYRGMKMEAAERYYREAAGLDPQSAAARANLALVLLELGQARQAAKAAREAVGLSPDDPRFQALLGQSLLKLGETQEAAELLESAVGKGVGGAEKLAALGRARDLLGQGDSALRAFAEAVKRDPEQPLVRYWRAECLRRIGRKDEAARELAHYQKCRDRQDRMAQLELKLAHDAKDVAALLELARLRVERGVPSQAIVLVMRAEQIAPTRDDVRALHQLVERAVAAGKDVES